MLSCRDPGDLRGRSLKSTAANRPGGHDPERETPCFHKCSCHLAQDSAGQKTIAPPPDVLGDPTNP